MASIAELSVDLIAHSSFTPPADIDFMPTESSGDSVTDADALIEFAGRACYETWDKPNPHTQHNEAYIRHILEVGHTALLEHATATMYIRGLSRLCSHELIRHRHFSFSQLSQRFVPDQDASVVVPPAIADDPFLRELFLASADVAHTTFNELLDNLDDEDSKQSNSVLRTKQARQAARAILPGAEETRLVVTGNYRTWRHFIGMRATDHADREIRQLAIACLEVLQQAAPHAFGDFEISTMKDGSRVATSPLVSES